uniref:BTB domain-containing protein n=1 Tax=Panagrellus redivivus TaxID=6233 RepID=A0A7E4V8G6_PANRE
MAVFECLPKKYQSVVKIVIGESFLDTKGNRFETPVCRFDDLDAVSFSVVCESVPYNTSGVFDLKVAIISNTLLKLSCSFDGAVTALAHYSNSSYFPRTSIKNLCKDGKLNINVTVTYETNPYAPTVTPNSLQLQPHQLISNADDSTDAKVVVGDEENKIHRGFLSIVSPVFKAMFDHNTKESKDGIVNIKDMDATVVKDSINVLYGHQVELKTIPQAIGILEFFEKYLIKGATERLESWISEKLNFADFVTVINYAWGHSSEKLQKRCREFFRNNLQFALSEGYRQLPIDTIMSLSMNDHK